jgi:mannose-6-phosphate isomerase-like protein (cupin superfamily)
VEHVKIRRVVTGHDSAGRGRVVDDRGVEPITSELMPGCAAYRLWGRDERPTLPDDGTPRPAAAWYPPPAGSRFMINTIPPGELVPPADLDTAAAIAELERQMPGAIAAMEPDAPGMHTTDSVDYGICLEGELHLELDDGEEVTLTPGACVVQRGTRHAWHNRSDQPALMCYVLIGADRTS